MKAKNKQARKDAKHQEKEEKAKQNDFRRKQREKVGSMLRRARERAAQAMLDSVDPATGQDDVPK